MIEPAQIRRDVKSEHSIVVHIRDTLGYVDGLELPLLPTSTIRDIKSLILSHSNQLPRHLILDYEEYSSLEDHKQLRDYGVQNGSTISVLTEFKIYLNWNAPEKTRLSVIVTTAATVSVIRLLALEKACKDSGLNAFEQVMTCAGQVLHDSENQCPPLGSYSQLVPGCEIYFNQLRGKRIFPSVFLHSFEYHMRALSAVHPNVLKFRTIRACSSSEV
jgi:hypothetical protein